MAQTIPQPIGPWKVRIDHTCWTHGSIHKVQKACSRFHWTLNWSSFFLLFLDPSSFHLGSTDHRVRPGALPGQAHGVHCLLPEHHGVRDGQHPLPEGRVWRVSIHRSSPHIRIDKSCFRNDQRATSVSVPLSDGFILNFRLTAGWAMSTPASAASSLSWRRETTPALRPTVAATPTALRGWSPSGPSAVL